MSGWVNVQRDIPTPYVRPSIARQPHGRGHVLNGDDARDGREAHEIHGGAAVPGAHADVEVHGVAKADDGPFQPLHGRSIRGWSPFQT